MIKKLRFKFVFVSSLSVALMLLLIVTSINIYNFANLNERANTMLSFITENNGVLPKPSKNDKNSIKHKDIPREAMFDTRYFVVYYKGNQIVHTDTGSIFSASSKNAADYALKVMQKGKSVGVIDDYKYKIALINGIDAIIFVDISRDMNMFRDFLKSSSLISVIALLLMVVISYFLSPIAIKPIVTSYEKQKMFITNASHEIKTPLTVISANMDILEMQSENKWAVSAREQVQRLTELVNSMVALSRMEESEELQKSDVSLSELSEMVAESYMGIALASEKEFTTSIDKDVTVTGDEKALSQLFYILLDNAFKYSSQQGEIDFSLKKNGTKAIFTVTNSVESIQIGNHKEYFDRFYREDESRNSKTGGFGIGLSLAKSIVEKHKGKIIAKSDDAHSFTIQVII